MSEGEDKAKRVLPKERSSILAAFNAKKADARQRLARSFVALVKLPFSKRHAKMKDYPIGFIVCATECDMGGWVNDNFVGHYVGNPGVHATEMLELLRGTEEYFTSRYSSNDVHASIVMQSLSGYFQSVNEEYFLPLAMGIEAIFVDFYGTAHWLGFDGEHDDLSMRTSKREVLIRGCYDDDLRRKVRRFLERHLLGRRKAVPTARLKQLSAQLKKLTGCKEVVITSLA